MIYQHSTKVTSSAVETWPFYASGAIEVSAIVDNVRHSKVYYGYSSRDAVRLFVREMNNSNGG